MNDDLKKHLEDIRVRLWGLQKTMRDMADDIFDLYMSLDGILRGEDEEEEDDDI